MFLLKYTTFIPFVNCRNSRNLNLILSGRKGRVLSFDLLKKNEGGDFMKLK